MNDDQEIVAITVLDAIDLDNRDGVIMPVITTEQAMVFRGGRRRYFTRKAALRGYASEKYRAKHPCECEQPDGPNDPGYYCAACESRGPVLSRYVRVLRRAEGR